MTRLAESGAAPGMIGGMPASAAEAVRNAHQWFEVNSGWAPPDDLTLAEWLADGVCRCPDDCMVRPEGWCAHGLASWWLILEDLAAR
jgi:hypothetical protein